MSKEDRALKLTTEINRIVERYKNELIRFVVWECEKALEEVASDFIEMRKRLGTASDGEDALLFRVVDQWRNRVVNESFTLSTMYAWRKSETEKDGSGDMTEC